MELSKIIWWQCVHVSINMCSWYTVGKTVVENVCIAGFQFKMCVLGREAVLNAFGLLPIANIHPTLD